MQKRNYITVLPGTYRRFIIFKGMLENRTGILHTMNDALAELLNRAGVPDENDSRRSDDE